MASPHRSRLLTKAIAKGWRQALGPWVQDNVAANQAAVVIKVGATAAPQTELVTPRAGSVTGITLSATVAPAGTDATFTVTKNGSAISGCILTVAAGATLGRSATFTPGTYPIAASDRLGVTVTTGAGWTATTSDVAVCVEVETE